MTYTEYAKVKNVLTANTKWGKRRVCNVITDQGDEAIWASDLSAFSNIKAGQTLNVIRGAKGSLTILENTPTSNGNASSLRFHSERMRSEGNGNIQMNRPSHDSGSSRNHYTYNSQEVSKDIEDIIHDVPMLSNLDKKKVAAFIEQQAKLYRFTVDTVTKQFPELSGVDDRGIRSIALSLLINTNMMINKNL